MSESENLEEAQEYKPEQVEASCEEAMNTMSGTIRRANKIPNSKKISNIKKKKKLQDFTENVVKTLTNMMKIEQTAVTLKVDDPEFIMERLIDANDRILDRIHSNIDCFDKGIKPKNLAETSARGGLSNPIVTTIKVGATTYTGGKNIVAPQIFFKDKVDNSATPFVPKITHKPHSLRPLALEPQYNDCGEVIGYKHPYEYELTVTQPKLSWLKPEPGDIELPLPLESTSLTFVDNVAQLHELLAHLHTVDELAIDLEHHHTRSFLGFTCLIQITTDRDYVIDALALRSELHILNEIFTNPDILKILHGAGNDILWLQRDFGVYIVNMFDTHQASVVLSLPKRSLGALLTHYCGVTTDKSYQLADWRLRPLPDSMLRYARIDTHYLPYIWRRMRRDLIQADKGQTKLLENVFQASKKICLSVYRKPLVQHNDPILMICRNRKYNFQQMSAVRLLHEWRFEQGRERDDNPNFLLPNNMLLSLCEHLPKDKEAICALCSPVSPFIKENIMTIHQTIMHCRRLTNNNVAIPSTSIASTPVVGPIVEALYSDYNVHEKYNPNTKADSATTVKQEENTGKEIVPELLIFLEDKGPPCRKLKIKCAWDHFLSPYERYRNYCDYIQVQEIKTEPKIIVKRNDRVPDTKLPPPSSSAENAKIKHTNEQKNETTSPVTEITHKFHVPKVRKEVNKEASTSSGNSFNRASSNPYRNASYAKYYAGNQKKNKRKK
ncbi:exosome component 10 [Bicyclus anynana]|uniref:Exosome component 10 n=1 Tax=Bicyclus anynana TaxID=110368 RepID=A0A6J1MQ89_BICAN|nr:exosome component 10 [Bicyclus anynana]